MAGQCRGDGFLGKREQDRIRPSQGTRPPNPGGSASRMRQPGTIGPQTSPRDREPPQSPPAVRPWAEGYGRLPPTVPPEPRFALRAGLELLLVVPTRVSSEPLSHLTGVPHGIGLPP